ncbi:hypothetical protein [Elizabethkingia meningoseptica]|uniref:hypothetical protein n=1 Tax=Elizabethkingia meningoseptica TaxID=238 RepID=UPI003891726F
MIHNNKKEAMLLQVKKEYIKPVIKILQIEMESGIAAQSATLSPGDINSPNIPQVEDWNDGGNLGGKDFDL